jgi:predicted amidohydrolase YtcJ
MADAPILAPLEPVVRKGGDTDTWDVPAAPHRSHQQVFVVFNAHLFDCPPTHSALYARDGVIRSVGPLSEVLEFAASDLGMPRDKTRAPLTVDTFEDFLCGATSTPKSDDSIDSEHLNRTVASHYPIDYYIVDGRRPGLIRGRDTTGVGSPVSTRSGGRRGGKGFKQQEDSAAADAAMKTERAGGDSDAPGLLVCPGFVDAHVHLLDAGRRAAGVTLRDVTNKFVFREAVKAAAHRLPKGTWITGGDWDERNLGGEEPDRTWIDDITPDHPVLLSRFDCHTALVNEVAFKLAGIAVTDDIEVAGGVFERYSAAAKKTVSLSGIVRERAIARIKEAFPQSDSMENMTASLVAAGFELTRHGITGVHTMTSLDFGNKGEIEFFEHMAKHAQLPVRVACAVRPKELAWVRDRKSSLVAQSSHGPSPGADEHGTMLAGSFGDKPMLPPVPTDEMLRGHRYDPDRWVRVLGVKTFLDGSLGSRTACFLKPFNDRGGTGVSMVKDETLMELLRTTDEAGVMLMAHAIGDASVRQLLSCFEEYVTKQRPDTPLRGMPIQLRVEHCQHVSDGDVERIKRLTKFGEKEAMATNSEMFGGTVRVIASMQPTHADTDKDGVIDAIGAERTKETYRFKSLKDAGAVLAFGSDWMVMPPRPVDCIAAAMNPPAPFASDEAISAADAIRALSYRPGCGGSLGRPFRQNRTRLRCRSHHPAARHHARECCASAARRTPHRVHCRRRHRPLRSPAPGTACTYLRHTGDVEVATSISTPRQVFFSSRPVVRTHKRRSP